MFENEIRRIIDNDFKGNYLGEGSSRICFALDRMYCVKISKPDRFDKEFFHEFGYYYPDSRGIDQSKKELEVWRDCPNELRYLLNPIIEWGYYKDYIYIIQERVEMLNEGLDLYDFEDICAEFEINEDDLYDDIEKLCEKFGLCIADFTDNTSNIGLIGDGIIYVDYGYTGF